MINTSIRSVNRLQVLHRQLSSMAPINISKKYDYLVIGGGSGGVASARRAASYGKKVLLVESKFEKLGGTCVNVGCVPKKLMWHAADLAHKKHHWSKYGLSKNSLEQDKVKFGDFNWGYIKEKRDAYIKRLNGIYGRNLDNEGVEYLYGFAKFLNGDGDVEVSLSADQKLEFLETPQAEFKKGEKLIFKADKVLIATGGAPIIPPDVEGSELGITSDGFFELEYQPKSVAIVGAGYIGVELSGVFQSLGTETHLIIRGDTVLRAFDDSIQQTVTDYYTDKLGVNVVKSSGNVSKIEKLANGLKRVTTGNGSSFDVEEVIWTIGRAGELEMGLDKVGVKVENGKIVVDEYQQTSNPNILSLGDVVGNVELTPVAIAAGRRLSNRLFSGQTKFADDKLDYNNIPSVIFSHPEAGSIGLSEKDAIAKFGKDDIKIYKTKFISLYNSMLDIDELKSPTSYKLIVQGSNEKVVGLHIVGESSAEILQGFGVAIKMGATKQDFDNCVAIHPTSAEEIVTLK